MTREELEDFLNNSNEEKLDELVHDCKGLEASNINNEGIESQIDYLLEFGLTLEEIEEMARDTKKKRLESAGWKIGSAEEFLGLGED